MPIPPLPSPVSPQPARRHGLRRAAVVLGLVLGVLLTLVAGGAAWWIHRIDPAQLSQSVAAQVQAATGRSLSIGGPVELAVLPRLRIVASDIAFANAAWSRDPVMLRAGRLEAELSWLPLLRGEVRVGRLVLDAVDLLLETDARGNANWTLQAAPDAAVPAEGGQQAMPGLGEVRVSDARLRWRDGLQRRERTMQVDRLSIARRSAGTDRLDMQASLDGQPFTLAGSVPDSASVRARREGAPVDLALSTDGARATLRGTVSLAAGGPLDLRGEATIEHWRGLERLAGRALAGPAPAGLAFRASGRPASLALDPLEVRLGTDTLRGTAAWQSGAAGQRPTVRVDLAGDSVDLSRLAPTAPRKPSADRRLFSDAALPFDAIGSRDVEARLRIGLLRLRSGLEAGPVAIEATAQGGRASIRAPGIRTAGGEASVAIDIEAKAARPRVRIQASGSELSMETLTADRGRSRMSGGSTTFSIDVAGSGPSLRALAASAEGDVRISTGPARIGAGGFDLGGDLLVRVFAAINPFHASDRATELQCAAVRLPVRAGIIDADRSIAYETRRTNVVASGRIDLRNETVDLVVRPTVKEGLGIGAGQLARLVRVTGPLREPSLALDATGALRTAATVGGAVATGGLSLIAEALLDRHASDPAPCRTALSGGRGAATGQGSAGRSGGGSGSGVLDGARRLFGLGR